jgi:tetratricopeptide (TPR) repeat protein
VLKNSQLNSLQRALHYCQGYGLFFSQCNTQAQKAPLVTHLKTNVQPSIAELALVPENDVYIDIQIARLASNLSRNSVIFIYDIEKLFYLKERYLLNELSSRHNLYKNLKCSIVFWLPEFLLAEIFDHAADFANNYTGLYNFSSPPPETFSLTHWKNDSFIEQLSFKERQHWVIQLKNLLAESGPENHAARSDLLNRLGLIYNSIGVYHKAIDCYQEDLTLSRQLRDKRNEGNALHSISSVYMTQGNYKRALQYLKKSLRVRQAINDVKGEESTLNTLIEIYSTKGDREKTLQSLEKLLVIKQSANDKQGEASTLNLLATVAIAKDDNKMAQQHMEKSLVILQAIGDKKGESETLNNLATAAHTQGEHELAIQYSEQSLIITRVINNKPSEAVALHNISQIYKMRGDNKMALDYLEQSLEIRLAMNDKKAACRTLFNIGHIHWQNNHLQETISTWQQTYKIAEEIDFSQVLQALESMAKELGGEDLSFWKNPKPLKSLQ